MASAPGSRRPCFAGFPSATAKAAIADLLRPLTEEVKKTTLCSEAELQQEKASFFEIRKSQSADNISHEALIRTWDKARAWAGHV